MTSVLVVYGTVEGQSRKIAEHVCDYAARECRASRVVDAARLPRDLDLSAFDAVIVVASVHAGRHQQAAEHFVRDHAAALQARAGALVSVSLSAADMEAGDMDEARKYVDVFLGDTGWIPQAVHYAAGALRFARYDFFKRWMMRRIAARKGLAEGVDEDEMELTDWSALDRFVEDFLHEHAPLGK